MAAAEELWLLMSVPRQKGIDPGRQKNAEYE
jgi:hypothetical protein